MWSAEVPVHIDIWSDIACPWCTIGRQNVNNAIAAYTARPDTPDEVTFRWRSFELDSTAPAKIEGDYVQKLADKYGMSRERSQQMMDQMSTRGAELGVDFNFEMLQAGNTFDCHRLLHLAHESGVQDALKARFFQAYFAEGQLMSDTEVLVALAVEVGLDEERVRSVLASDEFAQAVRQDQQIARQIGINGVPFYVIDERIGLSGAQPPEVLMQAFDQAWSATSPQVEPSSEAPECGPDGCAI